MHYANIVKIPDDYTEMLEKSITINGVAMIRIHTYEIEISYRTQGKQDRIQKHEEDKIHMKRKCIGSLVLIYHLPCALM